MRGLDQELQINGLGAGAREAESMPLTSLANQLLQRKDGHDASPFQESLRARRGPRHVPATRLPGHVPWCPEAGAVTGRERREQRFKLRRSSICNAG
ncbi:hypothetical protein VTN96DRAFT_6458 [Rasamsonia emersonii]